MGQVNTSRFADTSRRLRRRLPERALKALSIFLAVLVVDGRAVPVLPDPPAAREARGARSVTPAATLGDEVIPLEEVQEALTVQLAQIERQRYALLCQELDQLIGDRLIAQEARRRGTTPVALLKTEVYARVPEVTEEDVTAFIAQNRGRLPQGDQAGLRLKVSDYLRAQRITHQRQAYLRGLRTRTSVSLSLEEPATGRRCLDVDRYARVVAKVSPKEGYTLPVKWGDLGVKLVQLGVIDLEKFKGLYPKNDPPADLRRLEVPSDALITISAENQRFLVTVFWGLGLANKNPVLDKALAEQGLQKMMGLASTGGWTLGKKPAADLYSRFDIVPLTPGQQKLVAELAGSIYRPCCDNPTLFPDCNHGIALLGLIELMAAHGLSRQEILKAALELNAFWFPEHYAKVALLFDLRGTDWDRVDPGEVLGSKYSSLSGWTRHVSQELDKIVFFPSRAEQSTCGL